MPYRTSLFVNLLIFFLWMKTDAHVRWLIVYRSCSKQISFPQFQGISILKTENQQAIGAKKNIMITRLRLQRLSKQSTHPLTNTDPYRTTPSSTEEIPSGLLLASACLPAQVLHFAATEPHRTCSSTQLTRTSQSSLFISHFSRFTNGINRCAVCVLRLLVHF